MVDTIEVVIRVQGPSSLAAITLVGGVGKQRVSSRVRTVRLGLSRDSLAGVPLSSVLWYVGQAFLAAAKQSRGAVLPVDLKPPPAPPGGPRGRLENVPLPGMPLVPPGVLTGSVH